MADKATGYSLLTIGLIIIVLALFGAYTVFTGKSQPAHIFTFPSIELRVTDIFQGMDPATVQALIQANKGEVPTFELVPGSMLSETANFAAHLFFMGFVASVGARIARIGAMMARPINVKVKEASIPKK